jgi:hypothetical protein
MKSKMVAFFAALMIALMVAGFAYAHWSQTIYIEGTVESGTVRVGWLDVDYMDAEYLDKDVGGVDAYLVDVKGDHDGDPIYERLVVELSNVYPSYEAYLEISIANGGTIPVNLVDFDIGPVSDPDGLLPFVYWDIDHVDWSDYPQIDPCQTVTIGVYIHILQEVSGVICPQGASATFVGYLTFDQWNYVP